MGDIKDWIAGIADEAAGLAKRATGELAARPDLVLEGECQQAKGRLKVKAAQDSATSLSTLGWKLDPMERQTLLARFPAHYANIVADHVTLTSAAPAEAPLPPPRQAKVVGHIDNGLGVQAPVVAIGGITNRPDGGTFHITWSLEPERRPGESNDVLRDIAWLALPEPVFITLLPARF